MRRLTTIDEVRTASRQARAQGRRVGLVPTMGALHAGHLQLVTAARAVCDVVVVSIFVNPTQFAPGEDLDAYPRDLDGDERKLADLGDDAPDLVFAPGVDEVYPGQRYTTVAVHPLNARLCGVSRPTHFDGVTTVVAKLLHMVEPDAAFFGRKDFQQLTIIRTMVRDLNMPTEIVGVPTVREPDGLAMSSRNLYLESDERLAARAVSRALRAAVEVARRARESGHSPSAEVIGAAAADILDNESAVRTDYVEVVDPDTLAPPEASTGGDGAGEDATGTRHLLVAVAAYVGKARLIDNVLIGDLADEDRLLAATSA